MFSPCKCELQLSLRSMIFRDYVFSFSAQVPWIVPSSGRPVFCLVCLTCDSTGGLLAPAKLKAGIQKVIRSLQSRFPGNMPNSSLKFALLKFRRATLLTSFLSTAKILNSAISWSLWSRQSPPVKSPTSPSLLSNSRSRRAHYSVGPISTFSDLRWYN